MNPVRVAEQHLVVDETDFYLAFGSVVRGRRHACGRSCEELAVASGVQLTDLNEIEDGRRAASLGDLFLLASALGTPPHLLVRDVRQLSWLAAMPAGGKELQ